MTTDSTERGGFLRRVVIVSWLLYALTFVSFHADYLLQWVFAGLAVLGFVVALLALFRVRFWRAASVVLAALFLVVYVDYWVWITDTAKASRPDLAGPVAIGHIIEQGWSIFQHRLTTGAIFAAFKVLYAELLMPLVQLLLLIAFLVLRASGPNKPATESAA